MNVRRADGSVAGARSSCVEAGARRVVGAGDEDVGDRAADERVGVRAEQADDADAALGDRAVGRAEHVAAVGETEQRLFEIAVDLGGGRGQLAAQKIHALSIGRRGDWLSARGVAREMSRPRGAGGADRAQPRSSAGVPEFFTDTPLLTERFDAALHYATAHHAQQLRKGTPIPYAAHLLAVASLVLEMRGDEDEAIGALLHDVVEDGGGPEALAYIEQHFGANVADDRARQQRLGDGRGGEGAVV